MIKSLKSSITLFLIFLTLTEASVILVPRRGGGGGGHGGGGSHGGSDGGGSSGGSSGSHGSSGGSTPKGSSSGSGSTTGSRGSTTYHSSSGGNYYAGGASTPYTAGATSSLGLRPNRLLLPAALGFFVGTWLFGAYEYDYPNEYTFYNASAGSNQTVPVICLCQEYEQCSCDDNGDTGWFDDIIGNGTVSALNPTVVQVADINGTNTIVINGTLANGTTTATSGASRSLELDSKYSVGWLTLVAVVFSSFDCI